MEEIRLKEGEDEKLNSLLAKLDEEKDEQK